MKRAVMLSAVAAVLLSVGVGAQGRNFSGAWVIDSEKTAAAGGGAMGGRGGGGGGGAVARSGGDGSAGAVARLPQRASVALVAVVAAESHPACR